MWSREELVALGLSSDLGTSREEAQRDVARIMMDVPAILKGITPQSLARARAAAVLHLLGYPGEARKALCRPVETGIPLDLTAAHHAFVLSATAAADLETARNSGVLQAAEVVPEIDPSYCCSACAELGGRRFPIEEVPVILFASCSSSEGCRCTYFFFDK
jgi:hypothetical protein